MQPSGSRWWRWKYRFEGKEKRLWFGVYPDVSLRQARDRRDDARRLLATGVDPGAARRAEKLVASGHDTFEVVARDWYQRHLHTWTPKHGATVLQRLEANVFPWIGARSCASILAPELLTVFRRIEERGALETAHRIKQVCSQVFRYAIATGRGDRDPTGDLRGALPPPKVRHHPAILEPRRVGALLRALDAYEGATVTKAALRLAPLVFVRPGELRKAQWSEIDLERAEWRIPAERMKMRKPHLVPLSTQAVSILKDLAPLTRRPNVTQPDAPLYVFPGARTRTRPMSDNAVLAALRRMGFAKEEMTGHGFRSMASTLLHEQGWNHQAIERQLAHVEGNSVSAAYNFSEHLPERKRMMQAWADYLDQLKADTLVGA